VFRFGRKPTFLFFTYWQFIVGFCISFAQSFTVYAALYFLNGSGSLINFMVASVIGERLIDVSYTANGISGLSGLSPNAPNMSFRAAYRDSWIISNKKRNIPLQKYYHNPGSGRFKPSPQSPTALSRKRLKTKQQAELF